MLAPTTMAEDDLPEDGLPDFESVAAPELEPAPELESVLPLEPDLLLLELQPAVTAAIDVSATAARAVRWNRDGVDERMVDNPSTVRWMR